MRHQWTGRMGRTLVVMLTLAAVLAPARADAQRQTPRRRGQTIEIRGQVPTPQVVTVRPRETPQFSRMVLVPDFFDRHFWGFILPGYQLVPRSTITGSAADTVVLAERSRPIVPAVGVAASPPPVTPPPVAARPQVSPDTVASASRDAEIEAIRREIEQRRARLDSIAGRVREMGRPSTPADTTRRPPR